MPGVPAGRINRNATFQQKSLTPDDAGQPQETWTDLHVQRVAVEALREREVFLARQAGVIASIKITIWYRADIHQAAPLLRILLDNGTRVLNVVSAHEVPGAIRRQLELLCSEREPWVTPP